MKVSRRTLIEAGVVGAAALAYGGSRLANAFLLGPVPKGGRIDTHHHFMPDVFVRTIGANRLASVTPNRKLPQWSVQRALDMCGTFGIGEAILSISPGYPPLSAAIEAPLMQQCNEIAATIRSDHPGKFGHFASVPLFGTALALREIEHAFGALKSDGVVVFSNYAGKYLGDAAFDEVWAELNKRRAAVFVHPTHPQYELAGQPPQSILEFPFDTTRAAISLIYSGTTRKYPDIRFILSHAGGALPYLAARANGGAMFDAAVHERVPDVLGEVRKFYFDTALSGNPAALAALLTVADPARITFGSDFPYAPEIGIRVNAAGLDHYPFDNGVLARIDRGNAARLLGRPEVAAS